MGCRNEIRNLLSRRARMINKKINYILWFAFIFFTCTKKSSDQKNKSSANPSSIQEQSKEALEEANREAYSQGDPGPESTETTFKSEEKGIDITAPRGLLADNILPKIAVKEIREAFDIKKIPGHAVLIGEGLTIYVNNEAGEVVDNKLFANNFNIKLKIPSVENIKVEKLGVVLRMSNVDGSVTIQLLTQSDLQVHNNDLGIASHISFKVGTAVVDIQLVQIENQDLSETEIFYQRPLNPQSVECSANDPYSITLSWGVTGGATAAYKIRISTNEDEIKNDIGCLGASSFDELPATKRSMKISSLSPNIKYHLKICARNNRIPIDNSPGVYCSVSTPSPDIPILQLAYASELDNSLVYANKSNGEWNKYTVRTGDAGTLTAQFVTDSNDQPMIVMDVVDLIDGNNVYGINYYFIQGGVWQNTFFQDPHYGDMHVDTIGVDLNNNPIIIYSRHESQVGSTRHWFNHVNNEWKNSYNPQSNFQDAIFSSYGMGDISRGFAVNSIGQRMMLSPVNEYQGTIKYRIYQGSSWLTSASVAVDNSDCGNRMDGNAYTVVDKNDQFHIVFDCLNIRGNVGLYHGKFNGTTWQIGRINEIISTTFTTIYDNKLFATAVDNNDHAYIVYLDENEKTIKLSEKVNENFVSEKILDISSSIDVLSSVEYAVDLQGKHHIIYQKIIYGDHQTEGTFVPEKYSINYLTNMTGSWVSSVVAETCHLGVDEYASCYGVDDFQLRGFFINGISKKNSK